MVLKLAALLLGGTLFLSGTQGSWDHFLIGETCDGPAYITFTTGQPGLTWVDFGIDDPHLLSCRSPGCSGTLSEAPYGYSTTDYHFTAQVWTDDGEGTVDISDAGCE